jgi:DNA (cytosine-5)-methyltransferase 1
MASFAELRARAGMSTGQVAEFLGVSERTVFRYESGESRPKVRDLMALKGLIRAGGQIRLPVPSRTARASDFTFIDLFAGIGGLRRGFEAVGGKCVYTCEWDRYAQRTYKANFPDDDHEIAGDIRNVSIETIPSHDVLIAGFPCQPFSIAGVSKKNALGRPHGFSCNVQGTLFFDLAQIIAYHRPSLFVLENVKNLERHDGRKTFENIMHVLRKDLKYEVQHRVISSECWVPQKRERIFIIGFREQTDFDFSKFEYPERARPRLGDILESGVHPKYTLSQHLWNYLQDYKRKHSSKGNGFGYTVFGPDDVTRTLSARYFKDGSEILIDQPGGRPRRLTPRECSRLMGFDLPKGSEMKIPVSDTQAYKQFGNAVVVPVVEAVARFMKPHIVSAVRKSESDPGSKAVA